MCAHVVMVPQQVIQEIIEELEMQNRAKMMPDWPARWPSWPKDATDPSSPTGSEDLWQPNPQDMKSAFPGAQVPLIVPDEEARLTAKVMTWGYDVPWNKQVVFNTRFDTATKPGKNMWAESLAERRCVIPTFGFFEPHRSETFINPRSNKPNKQQYRFTSPNSPFVFIAGVFEGDRFSLMTTEPNTIMLPIHNRMPVVLEPSELDTWLFGEYLSLEDRGAIDLVATKVERAKKDERAEN